MCGGVGHRDESCGLRARIYAISGKTKLLTSSLNRATEMIKEDRALVKRQKKLCWKSVAKHAPVMVRKILGKRQCSRPAAGE